jgi:cytochrome c553
LIQIKNSAPKNWRYSPRSVEEQLIAFAQGLRQNDIFEQMRIIARQLTPDEVQAVAAFYGVSIGASVSMSEWRTGQSWADSNLRKRQH